MHCTTEVDARGSNLDVERVDQEARATRHYSHHYDDTITEVVVVVDDNQTNKSHNLLLM